MRGRRGASTISYVHGDHLGVPVVITDSAGAAVNNMQAEPFGRRFSTASTSAPRTSLAFPGQIIDIADRHYNLYRDYDPTLGRYLQADPIGLEGGDNVYGYVGGNPVGRVDPTGEFFFAPALIGGGIGALLDVGFQLLVNGGRWKCINWMQVGLAGATGAVGGAWTAGAFRHSVSGKRWAVASHNWKAVRQRYGRAHNLSPGQDVHHWFFPQSSKLPSGIVNHPFNLNPTVANAINRGRFNALGPIQRTIEGSPGWSRVAAAYGAGGLISEAIDDDCTCN